MIVRTLWDNKKRSIAHARQWKLRDSQKYTLSVPWLHPPAFKSEVLIQQKCQAGVFLSICICFKCATRQKSPVHRSKTLPAGLSDKHLSLSTAWPRTPEHSGISKPLNGLVVPERASWSPGALCSMIPAMSCNYSA